MARRSAARADLADLMDRIGHTGLAVADVAPGLAAAVDQHAAAVRDSLLSSLAALTAGGLAGYAHGLREAAGRHGWAPPEGPVDWTRADWVLTRLLAVCALSQALPARA